MSQIISFPSLQYTEDQLGDLVGWIKGGHYVYLTDRQKSRLFHLCDGVEKTQPAISEYLQRKWVIYVNIQALPELMDVWTVEILRRTEQGQTCTCNLQDRVASLQGIPHLENLELGCTVHQGRKILEQVRRAVKFLFHR